MVVVVGRQAIENKAGSASRLTVGDNEQEAGGRTEDTNLILFENERDKIYCDGEKEKGS